MTRRTFFVLLHLVEDDLRKDVFKAINSAGSPVTPMIKLAATIRWLAGGMYIDIAGVFGLSQVAFFHPLRGPLWPTLYALDTALANMVVFNTDLQSCQNAAAQFSYFSRNMFQNCVCAVDGLVIRTRCPSPNEMKAFSAPDLASYRNRKGCYGIVVMAACRANLEFVFFSPNILAVRTT